MLPLLPWFPLCKLLVSLGTPVAGDIAGDDPVKAVSPGSRGEGVGTPVATEVTDPGPRGRGINTPPDTSGLPCPVAMLARSSLPSFELP